MKTTDKKDNRIQDINISEGGTEMKLELENKAGFTRMNTCVSEIEDGMYVDAARLLDAAVDFVTGHRTSCGRSRKAEADGKTIAVYICDEETCDEMLSDVARATGFGTDEFDSVSAEGPQGIVLMRVERSTFGFAVTIDGTFLNHPRYGKIVRKSWSLLP